MAMGTPQPAGLPAAELSAFLARTSQLRILDVREPTEAIAGSLPGATLVPERALPRFAADELADRRADTLLLICSTGVRSARAATWLAGAGYPHVYSLQGGLAALHSLGFLGLTLAPIENQVALRPEEDERYARQIALDEVGVQGQARLLAARVALIGAGGLGCPAALYLAAAGVGQLRLIDGDNVEVSNLHRQVLHHRASVGTPKVESAKRALVAQNPAVVVLTHAERLTQSNVARLCGEADVIVDGSDNFATRYLLSDFALQRKIPLVSAAVHRFEGQLTVIAPGGPCYRCIFPNAPAGELAPNCAQAGVLGVVPGMLGVMQAAEVLKLLLGVGEPLVGQLLLLDIKNMRSSSFKVPRDPHCPSCGTSPEAAT